MEPLHENLLQETYKLALENNKMLRKIRRQAWWGRIVTLIIYAALVGAPIWFYMTYLSDTVDSLLRAYGQMQTSGQQARGQFEGFTDALQQFQDQVKSFGGTSSTSPSQ